MDCLKIPALFLIHKSTTVQVEMELFQHYRVSDLKDMVVLYLEELSRTQLSVLNSWEAFLPEIKRVM
jgi:hypothetical protein